MIRVALHDRLDVFQRQLSNTVQAAYHQVLNSDGAGSFRLHRSNPIVASYRILQGGIDGWIVHLERRGPYADAFSDHFSFVVEVVRFGVGDGEEEAAWVEVAGRGTLCLLEDRLVYPPDFDGETKASITSQWQNRTASGGYIMGAEIDRSNPRFALKLTHEFDFSTTLQTVSLRFDNLRKLHDYLCGNGLDAEMVGTDYRTYDHLGIAQTAPLRLGANLSRIEVDHDARPIKNYVVAQGTGEGINALLGVAADDFSAGNYRRREGFLEAREDQDQTQLNLRASSAVDQLKDPDEKITVDYVDTPGIQLYRDFSLGDTVPVLASPLDWSRNYRVVGIEVADTAGDREEIKLDLNSMRQEALLRLAETGKLTADSLNVINRQPQGAPYNNSRNLEGNCTPSFPLHFDVFIESNVLRLNYAKLSFFLRAFRRDFALIAGSSTSTGASSASSSASGSSHQHTTPDHSHLLFEWADPLPAGLGSQKYSYKWQGYTAAIDLATGENENNIETYGAGGGSTSGGEASHSHGIAHTHDVTANITVTDGIWEGATAAGVTVKINGVDRTAALGGGSGFDSNQTELEIRDWLEVGQWNTIDLTPTGLGRISADVRITGYLQSV